MAIDILNQLAQLVERERDSVLAAWRAQVRALPVARNLDVPTLNDHIPLLLAELVSALRTGSGETIAEALLDGSPPAHGLQRVKDARLQVNEAAWGILSGCNGAEEHDGKPCRHKCQEQRSNAAE